MKSATRLCFYTASQIMLFLFLSVTGFSQTLPDLALSKFSVTNSTIPAGSYSPGSIGYYNIGSGGSRTSYLNFYLSTDNVYDAGDVKIGEYSGPYMAEKSSTTKAITVYTPVGQLPGNYFVIAMADPTNLESESNELNNTTTIAITIISRTLDIVMQAPTAIIKGLPGYSVSLNASVLNSGNAKIQFTGSVSYYLSNDNMLDETDLLLGTQVSGTLEAAATFALTATPTIPANTSPGQYYIIFNADYMKQIVEDNETNNVAAQPLNINSPIIDLTLTILDVPSTVVQANPISIYSSVVNAGNVPATGKLGFYFSEDDLYDSSDIFLGTPPSPGQNTLVSTPENKPPGSYYILSFVDYQNLVIESDETNNVLAAPIVVAPRIVDLKIATPTAVAVASPAQTIYLSGVISNPGGNSVVKSSLGFYLSADTIFDPADIFFGNTSAFSVPLNSTAIIGASVIIPAATAFGNYYVLYYVDYLNGIDEANEKNNYVWKPIIIDATYKMTVNSTKSLNVCSGYLFDSGGLSDVYSNNETTTIITLYPGEENKKIKLEFNKFQFILEGYDNLKIYDGTSSSATLRGTYYGSSNPGIVYGTSASGAITLVFTSDNYAAYNGFGAAISCVFVLPTVDLYVESTSAPAVNIAGKAFSLSYSARNSGTLNASDAQVNFYLSTDMKYDAADQLIGYIGSGPLEAGLNFSPTYGGGNTVLSTTLPGYYYLLFYIDFYKNVAESDEANNVTARAILIINNGTDLMTSSLTVPTDAFTGATINFKSIVTNVGTVATSANDVGYYLSKNKTYESTDLFLGSSKINSLASAAAIQMSDNFLIPESVIGGEYYILSIADYNNQITESIETNNISVQEIIIKSQPVVDFIINDVLQIPVPIASGASLNIKYTINNKGTLASGISTTGFYLSTDATFDSNDLLISSNLEPILDGSSIVNQELFVTIPASVTDGQYYLFIVADYLKQIIESDDANNSASTSINISTHARLVITGMEAPKSTLVGETISISYTLQNVGTIASGISSTEFYLSKDDILDVGDLLVGSFDEISISAGSNVSDNTTIVIPKTVVAGQYYLIYKADNSNENMNTSSIVISIVSLPDLIINAVKAPENGIIGSTLNVEYSIKNTGTMDCAPSTSGLYLSEDEVLDQNDLLLTTISELSITRGIEVAMNVTITIPAVVTQGLYYLIVAADHKELITEIEKINNNSSVPITLSGSKTTGIIGKKLLISRIYPNPAETNLMVELSLSSMYTPLTIQLYDLSGMCVLDKEVLSLTNTISLDIENLSAGMYMIRLQTGNNVESSNIIIK